MKNAYGIFFLLLGALSFGNRLEASTKEISPSLTIVQTIHSCLKGNFDIRQMQIEVGIAQGRMQELQGGFDFNLSSFITQSHQVQTDFMDLDLSNATEVGLALSKIMTNGVKVTAAISSQRIEQPVVAPMAANVSSMNFSIEIPLMKNAGKNSVYAYVSAAKNGFTKNIFNLQNQICQSVKQTLIAYWEYVANMRMLEARNKAELRARSLVEDTEELIKRNEVAPAEIIQYQGNLGNKTSSRLAQEQSLYETKLNLGKLLGLSMEESVNLPLPSDGFPDIHAFRIKPESKELLVRLTAHAQTKRFDYLAMEIAKKTAHIIYKAAQKDTQPDVTLKLNVGYNGFNAGNGVTNFWNSFQDNIPGTNYNVGIYYRLPFANNADEGVFKQQYFFWQQAELLEDEMLADIRKEIVRYYQQISRLLQQYSFTKQSTENYGIALENEKIKYHMNMSTQMNVIDTEDKYIEAEIREINIEKEVAIAIINLLYSLGELGDLTDDQFVFTKENLLNLPEILAD